MTRVVPFALVLGFLFLLLAVAVFLLWRKRRNARVEAAAFAESLAARERRREARSKKTGLLTRREIESIAPESIHAPPPNGDYTEADNRDDADANADEHPDAASGHQGRRPEGAGKRPGADYLPGSTLTCAICLDTVEYGEAKRTLPCTHSYHSTCVRAWLKRVNRCPQCNNATVKERQRGIRRARRDARNAAAMAAAALAASGVIAPTGADVTEGVEGDGVEGGVVASGCTDPAPEFVVVPLGDAAATAAASPDGEQATACEQADSTGGPVPPVPCSRMPVEV
ncbi:hypothetical protein MMPV_003449 [Pyropia vietnamensis]